MRKKLRIVLIIIGVLALTLVVVVAVVLSNSPLNKTYPSAPRYAVELPTDEESLARGKYLVEAVAVCTICHGDDLGGQLAFRDDFLGSVHTPNLTSGDGGVGAAYSIEDWVRAVRYGVSPQNKGLIFMPVDSYYNLTDEDLGAIIAYIQSVPPVDRTDAVRNLTLPAQVMLSLGVSGQVARTELIDFEAALPQAPEDAGEYLVIIGGCSFCHGDDLRGGQGLEPGAPPGSNLLLGGPLDNYTLESFEKAMRFGLKLDGSMIDPLYMPWVGYNNLTDEDIALIWSYLRSK